MRAARVTFTFTFAFALAALALAPSAATADGLPIAGINTKQGVISADGAYTYTAEPGDEGRTLVTRTFEDGGSRRVGIDGKYVVPGVAVDETTSGLSHDGRTLVLIKPRVRFPQAETELVVLDAETLVVREPITLDGDYSFDALSPDGATMYLTEYPNPRDPTNYLVRAYDLATGVMAPDPIVDKSDPDEEMRGFPLTRVTGTGGRWEYTLYDGAGHEPFVHALDTVAAETLCIDLPWVEPRDVYQADLELVTDGATIKVDVRYGNGDHGPVAAIDTATGKAGPIGPRSVSQPEDDQPPEVTGATTGNDPDEAGIGSIGMIALVVIAVALLAAFVRLATGGRWRLG